jgi:hypothetical protein
MKLLFFNWGITSASERKEVYYLLSCEVVGSNPTRSLSFILGKYGITLRLILTDCPIKTLAMAWTDQAQISVMLV